MDELLTPDICVIGGGSGGLSAAASAFEGEFAFAWAKNIWADTLM